MGQRVRREEKKRPGQSAWSDKHGKSGGGIQRDRRVDTKRTSKGDWKKKKSRRLKQRNGGPMWHFLEKAKEQGAEGKRRGGEFFEEIGLIGK